MMFSRNVFWGATSPLLPPGMAGGRGGYGRHGSDALSPPTLLLPPPAIQTTHSYIWVTSYTHTNTVGQYIFLPIYIYFKFITKFVISKKNKCKSYCIHKSSIKLLY